MSTILHHTHLRKISIALHIFIGIGALAGGFSAVSNPESPMGISPDMLKNGPFDNFLIPGLFLMIVLGCGNLIAAAFTIKQHKWWPYMSGGMGDILVLWIVIQCLILFTIAGLHIIFFILGAIQSLLAIGVIYQKKLFPVNLR